MEEWAVFVEGAGLVPDFILLVQVPKSGNGPLIMEALKDCGWRHLFRAYVTEWVIDRNFDVPSAKRAHFTLTAKGPKHLFFCYVQTPLGTAPEQAPGLVNAIVEEGLASYLGPWQKRITAKRISETMPGALEKMPFAVGN